MGDDMGGGGGGSPAPQIGAEGLPVDQHGTKRDFGNMLNAHMGGHIKKGKKMKGASFSPWMKMGGAK